MERFYNIYVEKFSNIDYLEWELDQYNLMEEKRKNDMSNQWKKFKDDHDKKMEEENEVFAEDEDHKANGKKMGKGDEIFNEMRETRTGFGAKVKKEFNPGLHNAEGGLQPDDDEEDEDVEDDGDEEEDGEEGVDVEDEEDDGDDHNF